MDRRRQLDLMHAAMQGLMTGTETAVADLTQIGKARTGMLNVMLEKASDSVTGQTVIDPKGYLTDLQSMTSVRSATEVGDIQKARLLLKRLISTNPKHGPGWIAAARLEEVAGKMQAVCTSMPLVPRRASRPGHY